MSQYITRIRTSSGDLQIDYNALANLPDTDTTLSVSGSSADAKVTGDAIERLTESLNITNSNLIDTKYDANNNAISIDELQKITALLASSSSTSLDISSNNGAYRITVDNEGITFWYYTTKVGYIKNDTFHSINTKIEQSFSLADLTATVSDGYVSWA